VPVGLAAAAVTWTIYRTRDGERKVPIDGIGLGRSALGGRPADHARDPDRPGSMEIGLAVAALVGFALFIVWD
jgi:DHA2 family multidrug resistance protein